MGMRAGRDAEILKTVLRVEESTFLPSKQQAANEFEGQRPQQGGRRRRGAGVKNPWEWAGWLWEWLLRNCHDDLESSLDMQIYPRSKELSLHSWSEITSFS